MHCKVRRAGALQTPHTPDLGGRTRVTIFVTPTSNVEKPLTPTHLSYIYASTVCYRICIALPLDIIFFTRYCHRLFLGNIIFSTGRICISFHQNSDRKSAPNHLYPIKSAPNRLAGRPFFSLRLERLPI